MTFATNQLPIVIVELLRAVFDLRVASKPEELRGRPTKPCVRRQPPADGTERVVAAPEPFMQTADNIVDTNHGVVAESELKSWVNRATVDLCGDERDVPWQRLPEWGDQALLGYV